MFVGPVAEFPSKSSAAWTFGAEFPSLNYQRTLSGISLGVCHMDLGEEFPSAVPDL